MIDSHIHLDAELYADPEPLIKRALAAGVVAMVAPGTGPGSNHTVLALAREWPGVVHAALGFHPERFDLTGEDLEATLNLIHRERDEICAVGEVGIPRYGAPARLAEVRERARRVLGILARVASEMDLAIILHAPHESALEALAILRGAKARRAVFHWHKSDAATTRAILEAGYFISLTPEVVYRERDQELARLVPLASMLVETDGPYPYKGPFAGRATEPTMVAEAVAAIARIKNVAPEAVATATSSNARRLFRLPS